MIDTHYPRPVIPFLKTNVPRLITGSQLIHDGFVSNASLLGTPPVPLPTFQSQITDVISANQAMKSNKSAGPARTVKVNIVWGTVGSFKLYVAQLCASHPDQAAAYIAASGFQPSQVAIRNDVPLAVDATNVPGQVLLTIHSFLLDTPKNKPSAKRTHLLRHTLDGGKTFVADEATSNAHSLISGLPPLVTIGFEVAAKDSSGVSAWSPTVYVTLTK